VAATVAAGREAPPAVGAPSPRGRAFGGLVHRVLEWLPFDAPPEAALAMAEALAPSFGLDAEAARRAGEHAGRALGLPVMERARRSPTIAAVSDRLAVINFLPSLTREQVAGKIADGVAQGRRSVIVPARVAGLHAIREFPSRMNDLMLLGID